MRIAIQAADLDNQRIDGTRVYLLNMLNRFGSLSPDDDFFIFHKENFNPKLEPAIFFNYQILQKPSLFCWTQICFARELWKGDYDALWMPMQALPFVRRKNLRTTVTIHDLAFKYFPQFFPGNDLRRLNLFTDFAVKHSDKIIAVSQSTKKDILHFYPGIKEEKIKVIYHGFDPNLFQKKIPEEVTNNILSKFKVNGSRYILYVGALQPRKNLEQLIEAFEMIRIGKENLKLVLAGGKAWMWKNVIKLIEKSPYRDDIIVTGTIPFEEIAVLYQNAEIFVFPSLYEGFGIPILEAMASGVPVICNHNSSLPEVAGEAALYYKGLASGEMAIKIKEVLESKFVRDSLVRKGMEQIKKFSWDKCAKETLEFIKK